MGNEDPEELWEVVETWQATDAWQAIRKAVREGTSLDELHGQPMVDEMLSVFPVVMAEVREARKRKAEEQEAD